MARTTGRPGAAASSVGEGDAGGDRQDERALGQDVGAALERGDGVGRLDRHHQHLGVGRGPGRARDDPDPGQALLEVGGAGRGRPRRRRATRAPSRRRSGRRPGLRPCAHRPAVPGASGKANRGRLRAVGTAVARRATRVSPRNARLPPRTSPNGTVLLHLGPTPAGPRRDRLTQLNATCRPTATGLGGHFGSVRELHHGLEPALGQLVEHADDPVELLARRGARARAGPTR